MIKVTCTKCQNVEYAEGVQVLETPGDVLDRYEVKTLAAAIQRGDMQAAAMSLDVLFRDEPEIREWIALGRASLRAAA